MAPLVALTVLVLLAADGHAADERVTLEAGRTDAPGPVEVHLADGAVAARGGGAGVDALIVLAGLVAGTVLVADALV